MNSPWRQLWQLADSTPVTRSVPERQAAWLLQCLQRNRNTLYGQRYRFAAIKKPEDYQQQVPLVSYEDLKTWVVRMQDGEEDVLFKGRTLAFEMTGGSSGGSKLVPYSEASFQDFRKTLLPWLAALVELYGIEHGSAYFAISPACCKPPMLSSGIPVGLPDGAYLGKDVLVLFASISAVPPWVAMLDDVQPWQLATLYYLIHRNDLVMISVWSPTFFGMLLDAIDNHVDTLLKLFGEGGRLAQQTVYPDFESYKRLKKYLDKRDTVLLWPQLKLVSCWADASSKPFYVSLQQRIPHAAFQAKGLLSTEGVVTVPNRNGEVCLAVDSGFYEFIDTERTVHLCHELTEGQQYEVVMTTAGGLYRYLTGDQVYFQGMAGGLPVLPFIGRSGLASDMVGEKLTDEFVNYCLETVPGFRMLIPVTQPNPRYLLITDQSTKLDKKRTVATVEEKLSINPQYAYARRIGQLDSLGIVTLSRPLETYIETSLARGIRLGDIKVPALSCQEAWKSYVETMI